MLTKTVHDLSIRFDMKLSSCPWLKQVTALFKLGHQRSKCSPQSGCLLDMQQRGAKMVKVAIVAVQDCWEYPVTQSSCYGFAVSPRPARLVRPPLMCAKDWISYAVHR